MTEPTTDPTAEPATVGDVRDRALARFELARAHRLELAADLYDDPACVRLPGEIALAEAVHAAWGVAYLILSGASDTRTARDAMAAAADGALSDAAADVYAEVIAMLDALPEQVTS